MCYGGSDGTYLECPVNFCAAGQMPVLLLHSLKNKYKKYIYRWLNGECMYGCISDHDLVASRAKNYVTVYMPYWPY